MKKVLVSLSGGMDSATVLAKAIHERNDVFAVGFFYGSKHNRYENQAAQNLADHYKIPFRLIDLSGFISTFKSDLLLSGGDVPEGHYEEDSMSRTVVPGRNMIFASVLTGFAWSQGCEQIWMGMHAGDHYIYEDCRPSFFYAMNAAVVLGSGERVRLRAPFLYGNKSSIIFEGLQMSVPYSKTRTCYKNQEIACGKCGSCQERLEAFRNNGVDDPIQYESRKVIEKGANLP